MSPSHLPTVKAFFFYTKAQIFSWPLESGMMGLDCLLESCKKDWPATYLKKNRCVDDKCSQCHLEMHLKRNMLSTPVAVSRGLFYILCEFILKKQTFMKRNLLLYGKDLCTEVAGCRGQLPLSGWHWFHLFLLYPPLALPHNYRKVYMCTKIYFKEIRFAFDSEWKNEIN